LAEYIYSNNSSSLPDNTAGGQRRISSHGLYVAMAWPIL